MKCCHLTKSDSLDFLTHGFLKWVCTSCGFIVRAAWPFERKLMTSTVVLAWQHCGGHGWRNGDPSQENVITWGKTVQTPSQWSEQVQINKNDHRDRFILLLPATPNICLLYVFIYTHFSIFLPLPPNFKGTWTLFSTTLYILNQVFFSVPWNTHFPHCDVKNGTNTLPGRKKITKKHQQLSGTYSKNVRK